MFFGGLQLGNSKKDYCLHCKQQLESINCKLNQILEYQMATSKKYMDGDYKICKEFIEKNSYLTGKMIEQHPVLCLKYTNPNDIKRLMDGMFKHYDNLKEMKTGRGSKRFIFKKEDEDKVRQLLSVKRSQQRKKIIPSDIDDVKAYLSQFESKSIAEIYADLRMNLGIKSKSKIQQLLKDLNREGFLETKNFRIYINKRS